MFNGKCIELNTLKLSKRDKVFSVNFTTRTIELIGVIDDNYFLIYYNDKGYWKEYFKIR